MKNKKKKILVFGTFDRLHAGHRSFLRQAAKHGHFLYAVVARDNNVKALKRAMPQEKELARLKNIRQEKTVFQAFLGNKDYRKRMAIINKIKPDIVCLGYDQPQLKLRNKRIKIIRLKPHKPDKYKSSLLRSLAKKKAI